MKNQRKREEQLNHSYKSVAYAGMGLIILIIYLIIT